MQVIEWNGIPPGVHVSVTAADFAGLEDPVVAFALESLGSPP